MKSSIISSASSAMSMRGLTVFISDIRQCQSKEQEQNRVDRELAHIRQRFLGEANLSGYHKRKYVWKMLYIHMLGYEIDFGHMEAINLVSSPKYSEKSVGYLACTLLLHEEHELLALLINSMRNDILSGNEHFQTLALSCICNIGSKEFSEALAPDVIRILSPGAVSKAAKPAVKRRACLCLLRLYRKVPEILTAGEWSDKQLALLDERNMGVLTSALGLLLGIVARNSDGYEEAVPKICRLLTKYVVQKEYPTEYTYYQLPSPWLQVKLLRILQFFPPPEDRQLREVLHKVLQIILNSTEMQKNVNKNNACHAVFFEAIRLVIHLGRTSSLLTLACNLLAKYITIKDANLRYLGLETMALMAEKNDVSDQLVRHRSSILGALFKETDISIRRRCLDLLFNICDDEAAEEVVGELLRFLEKADYVIKEDVVLKIAVLSERHAHDFKWYVDVILRLISLAGDFVAEDVWWRVVQIITNNESVQLYAAQRVFDSLTPQHVHLTMTKVGCHVLGEYADQLVREGAITAQRVLDVLLSKLHTCPVETKAMILTAIGKLGNLFPEIASSVHDILQLHSNSLDSELQQRSCEYIALQSLPKLQQSVFEIMPAFPERESSVLKLVKEKMKGDVTDKREGAGDGQGDDDSSSRQTREDRPAIGTTHLDDDDSVRVDNLAKRQLPAPTAAPVVPPKPARSGLEELLDLGDALPAAPIQTQSSIYQTQSLAMPQAAPVSIPATAGSSSLDDLLGIASVPAPVAAAPAALGMFGARPAVNQQALVNHAQALIKLQTQALVDGVLYEDDFVQVGVKGKLQGNQYMMALYFGNKVDAAFTNFRSVVGPFPALDIQSKPPPNVVGSKQQVQHLLMLQCVAPFVECPPLEVSFNVNGTPCTILIKAPISPAAFTVPAPLDGQQFFARWGATAGANKDRQQIFKARDASCLQKAALDASTTNLHLASLAGVDPNPNNTVATGNVLTKGESVVVMIRLEANTRDGLIRASVRSGSPEVSLAIEKLVVAQLG
eukprot:c11487_g1_i1.p1 GENE.c11487_g1_i1~~c11487_g1_i1.p1  ORF type:complete len:1014 (-),score=266.40 c11487_g1_i1:149-3190(-)